MRSNIEIIAAILSFCIYPQGKTQVMYGTNLSWEAVQNYLPLLQSCGLLEIHRSLPKYVTTQKGLKFLDIWRELEELI